LNQAISPPQTTKQIILSIPYWDFLVLNQLLKLRVMNMEIETFNSLLGFSSFESNRELVLFAFDVVAFNSLLGFSSFESPPPTVRVTATMEWTAFNSLLGFSSFESQSMKIIDPHRKRTFNSLLGFSSFESTLK